MLNHPDYLAPTQRNQPVRCSLPGPRSMLAAARIESRTGGVPLCVPWFRLWAQVVAAVEMRF